MSAKSQIATLLGKELTRLLFNPIVVITLVTFLLALCLATVRSVDAYNWNLDQYNSITGPQPEGEVSNFGTNVMVAPRPNHILARGVSDIMSRPVGVMRQIRASFNMKYSVGQERRQTELIYSLVPDVDPMMAMRYLLAVLALLFAFDQVCAERQRGTLQQSLANPVRRRTLLTAKILAGLLALAVVVAMAALLVFATLWAMETSIPTAELWRTGAIFVAAFLYGASFLAIGILVSASVRTAGVSILVCLALWCLLVIVAPGAISQLAGALSPTPPAHSIYMTKLSIERNMRGSEVQEGTLEYLREFNREKLDAISREDENFHNLVMRQEALAQGMGLISPAIAFESVATAFAGTGVAEEHEMLRQLYRHFRALAEEDAFEAELAQRTEPDELPEFDYRPLPPEALVRGSLAQWGALVIITVILFGLAYWRFNRYDVR